MDNIGSFYDRIVNNYSRKPGELISFFIYYLTVESSDQGATAKKIKECFEACDLTPPSRIDIYLSNGTKAKPARYVKAPSGYRLQRHEREDIAGSLEPEKTSKEPTRIKKKLITKTITKKSSKKAATTIYSKEIFIVHGHEKYVREAVARYLEKLDLKPIILSEKANKGRTIIEKIEDHSNVPFAVVLLTADDIGGKDKKNLKSRTRQNVMLELGYFIGKLGRANVCSIKYGDIEIPTDFAGVLWDEFDDSGAWKTKLAKELEQAGYAIDWKKATS